MHRFAYYYSLYCCANELFDQQYYLLSCEMRWLSPESDVEYYDKAKPLLAQVNKI